jgi:thiol-disulfide isomerase/thioredoxin
VWAGPLKSVVNDEFFAKGTRRQVPGFGVTNAENLLQTINDQKNSIVAVGFWSTKCEPSLKMLQEFRNFQKQAAEHQMKLILWPVHFQPWPEVLHFLRLQQQHFEGAEVKRLGLGEHGLSQLFDELEVLPTVVLIDREGGIAAKWTGYQEGLLLTRINRLIVER